MSAPHTFADGVSVLGPVISKQLDDNFGAITSGPTNAQGYPFFADPTGSIDATSAIQAALNIGQDVYLPSGTYSISSTLVQRTGTMFHGAGIGTIIIQTGNNLPILTFHGEGTRTKWGDMKLTYLTPQVVANTNSRAIQGFDVNECVLDHFYISNAYCGIDVGAAEGANPNTIYSTTVSNGRIEQCTGLFMNLNAFNGGNSGNVVSNIYCVGASPAYLVQNPVNIKSWSDGVIEQLNIEQCTTVGAGFLNLNACDNLSITGLHLESLSHTVDFTGLITANGSRAFIRGLTIANTVYTTANVASIVALGGSSFVAGGQVVLENVMERGNTVTSANKSLFYSTSASSTARLIGYVLNSFTVGLSGGLGNLLQVDNKFTTTIVGETTLTYSASMSPDATGNSTYIIQATNGAAFTINAPSGVVIGQRLRFRIENVSSGALGTATWTGYKLAAWVQPASTFSRTIDFEYNGSNMIEASRTTLDVPN